MKKKPIRIRTDKNQLSKDAVINLQKIVGNWLAVQVKEVKMKY